MEEAAAALFGSQGILPGILAEEKKHEYLA